MVRRKLMTRSKVVFGLLLTLFGSSAAPAQVSIDVAKITCNQFNLFKITNPKNIALWVSGYYNAKRNNTIIDPQALEQNTVKVSRYCSMNPEMPVMQAVEAVEATLGNGK